MGNYCKTPGIPKTEECNRTFLNFFAYQTLFGCVCFSTKTNTAPPPHRTNGRSEETLANSFDSSSLDAATPRQLLRKWKFERNLPHVRKNDDDDRLSNDEGEEMSTKVASDLNE